MYIDAFSLEYHTEDTLIDTITHEYNKTCILMHFTGISHRSHIDNTGIITQLSYNMYIDAFHWNITQKTH